MKSYEIIQWGSTRSIVEETYSETGEKILLIIDNDYLMMLDEMGFVK